MISNLVLEKLTENDVEVLISIYTRSSNDSAKYVAAGLLLSLARGRDKLLSLELKRELSSAVRLYLSEYPKTELSLRSYSILEVIDPASSVSFILAINPANFRSSQLLSYILALKNLPYPLQTQRFRELEQIGGKIGKAASKVLAGHRAEAVIQD